jgi:hypothetical protein
LADWADFCYLPETSTFTCNDLRSDSYPAYAQTHESDRKNSLNHSKQAIIANDGYMSFSVRLQMAKTVSATAQSGRFMLKLMVSAGFTPDFHGRLMAFITRLTRFQAAVMSLIVNPCGSVA